MTLQREHVHCGKTGLTFDYPATHGGFEAAVIALPKG
jgi:hypothetical protein